MKPGLDFNGGSLHPILTAAWMNIIIIAIIAMMIGNIVTFLHLILPFYTTLVVSITCLLCGGDCISLKF